MSLPLAELYTTRHTQCQPWYQIVWEWEDDIAAVLGLTMRDCPPLRLDQVAGYLPIAPLLQQLPKYRNAPAVAYVMGLSPRRRFSFYNSPRIVPWIIDYFLPDDALPRFEQQFSRCPLVLVSSREAYERLQSLGCRLPIRHCALSISDRYHLDADKSFDKQVDLFVAGRLNKVLDTFLLRYVDEHPDFEYVGIKTTTDGGIYDRHFVSSHGRDFGSGNTREEYLNMLRASRSALYATPGIDTDQSRARGYNQVTPRFLEYLACGCHVIARYTDNPDTRYYDLSRFSPSVNNYEQFAALLDKARNEPADMAERAQYLMQHYTSRRAEELRQILTTL